MYYKSSIKYELIATVIDIFFLEFEGLILIMFVVLKNLQLDQMWKLVIINLILLGYDIKTFERDALLQLYRLKWCIISIWV